MPAVVGFIVPTVTGAGVFATDGGGWIAYPTASGCGIFHLYVGRGTDATSVPLAETFTEPLTPGSHDLALIGTDGNGPGTIQRLELSVTDSGGAAAVLFPEASPGRPVQPRRPEPHDARRDR